MFPVSLDCPFVLPLRYSLTFICPVSCVSYVASFSGLSIFFAPSVFFDIYLSCVLCILCCQFLWIDHFYCTLRIPKGQYTRAIERNWQHRVHKKQDYLNVREYRRGNKNEQSRETGNIGYTRHRTNKCKRIPKGQ
jgi:hypothetical protein